MRFPALSRKLRKSTDFLKQNSKTSGRYELFEIGFENFMNILIFETVFQKLLKNMDFLN